MDEYDISKLRHIELDMLLCIDSITKKLGIKYFLVGGSLLGAIRHQGFIPWDDDIDVGMLRHDYNRFIQEAQKMLPPYYFIQTNETDKEYYLTFAKLRDSRTTFVESSSANKNINHGVYIDIFPFDFYHKHSFMLKLVIRLALKRIRREYNFKKSHRSIKYKVASMLSLLIFPSASYASKILNKIYSHLGKGEYRVNYSGAWGEREIVKSEIFDNFDFYNFEGHLFRGPKDADSYLKHIYGNYMQLPPKDKQIPHHDTDMVDLDNSYTVYFTSKK